MSDDLVERLRASKMQGNAFLLAEAADEIERLRAALATEKLEMRGMHDSMFELRTEIERLRNDLTMARADWRNTLAEREHWKDRAEAAEGALADEEENKR